VDFQDRLPTIQIQKITLQQSADSILRNDVIQYSPIGSGFRYTGEDQQVAGAAAELAAGVSWATLFEEKLAQPLGLASTGFYLTTPTNPRIAGGIRTNAADMMRFGKFILHNGKNGDGIQVVDSLLLQELWKDQANRAGQFGSPYPNGEPFNNPYNADTVYYGLGTWLDIYNPVTGFQEQISADGAFRGIIWVNRCTNMVGVFLTFLPSLYVLTGETQSRAMDIFRNAVPDLCNTLTQTQEINQKESMILVYPNPSNAFIHLRLPDQNPVTIELANTLGQTIFAGSNQKFIDISNFPAGIYFLKAEAHNFREVVRIMKY